jgi:hypothetical protein
MLGCVAMFLHYFPAKSDKQAPVPPHLVWRSFIDRARRRRNVMNWK